MESKESPWSAQRRFFEANGYLVVPQFFLPQDGQVLRARARALVSGTAAEATFVWGSTKSEAGLLRSAADIAVFQSADPPPNRWERQEDVLGGTVKIGHALHDQDPIFAAFSRQRSLQDLVSDLGYVSPRLLQSMYLPKPPGLQDTVDWHQDACFLHTHPQRVLGFWFALDDAYIANGCLWVQPGSHHMGLARRWVRHSNGGLEYEEYLPSETNDLPGIPLIVSAGSLVVLHDTLLHRSGPNHSQCYREAYALHLMDGTAQFSDTNWLQRPENEPFRGV